jgi:hypothetical protein
MRIALFITCFNDTMFPSTGRAVTALLERLGHTVEFPQGQTCCGQMHFNTGYRPQTLPMVRRFAEVFAGYDAVVAPSGSCAGMVRDHHRVVAAQYGDTALTEAVEEVVPTVYEPTCPAPRTPAAHHPHTVTATTTWGRTSSNSSANALPNTAPRWSAFRRHVPLPRSKTRWHAPEHVRWSSRRTCPPI